MLIKERHAYKLRRLSLFVQYNAKPLLRPPSSPSSDEQHLSVENINVRRVKERAEQEEAEQA